MRRVLFLAIDGVLNRRVLRLCSPEVPVQSPRQLEPDCVERLRRVARAAELVLSSAWPEESAAEALARHGLHVASALDEERKLVEARPDAILRWLAAHPEVTSWVALDEDWMRAAWLGPDGSALGAEPWRLVRTDAERGLTDRDADAAEVVLYEGRAPLMPEPGDPDPSLPCHACGCASVYAGDLGAGHAPRFACAAHAWPAPAIAWRGVRRADRG
jgi:hypothetical protein